MVLGVCVALALAALIGAWLCERRYREREAYSRLDHVRWIRRQAQSEMAKATNEAMANILRVVEEARRKP